MLNIVKQMMRKIRIKDSGDTGILPGTKIDIVEFTRINQEVLVKGKRCPIIGNICMDQLMVDVSEVEDVHEGDFITLVGREGNEQVKIDEWSRLANTINNDMMCRISARVPRFYSPLK